MLKGMICLFFGLIAAIPDGWSLCDGDNDTPDLRNRFVIGAGDTYAVDDSGGAINHTHTFTGDGHIHWLAGPAAISDGAGFAGVPSREPATGTTDAGDVLPPYYALSYIMKDG